MPFNPQDERINNLEQDLYSRDAKPITAKKRPELSQSEKMVQYGWKDEKPLGEELAEIAPKKSSVVTKIFLASVLFFVIAAGIAGYIILGGFNVISSKNVDISVRGLVAAAAGEEMSLDIIVKNNNNAALDRGTIFIEYPQGTRRADDITKELTREHLEFGVVPAGTATTETVKAVFFGQKDSVQQIKISVEYQARGSNVTFSKEKTYDVTIKSSPILMTVEVPQEVNSGQEITMKVEVASNSNTLVRNLVVKAEYPFGFNYTGASPAPTFDTNLWQLGDFDPKEKKTITIKGRMIGQNEEERTFRFMTGTASENDERNLEISYVTLQQPIFIKKPFLGLGMRLGSQEGETVISAGDSIQGVLTWTNNLPIAVNDVTIKVKLSGRGLDRNEVNPGENGFFRSSDNTIIWDKNALSDLRSIEPGENGSVGFSISALPSSTQLLSTGRNMDIVVDAVVEGTRIQGGVPSQVQSEISSKAKVGTNLVINGRVIYSIGPFNNSGPLPPRADQKTTYTVVWNVSNSFNDVSNVTLSTKLPPYVRWLGKTSPSAEQVTYDESSRIVTWSIPDLRAGVGYTSSPKEAAFQIELQPSVSQVNSQPDLTGELIINGNDRFTGKPVQGTKPALNTRLSTDPDFHSGDERVER